MPAGAKFVSQNANQSQNVYVAFVIDHDRKLILLHISRTGGTSIEKACVGRDWWEIDSASKHLSARQARALYGEHIWNTYTVFTIVRNPWDRLVSMWDTGWWHPATAAGGPQVSLREFLLALQPLPNEPYNSLFYHEILDDSVDVVLRFETLREAFQALLRAVGAPPVRLPHVHRRKHRHYSTYYDEETRNLVAERWARDIEMFGYRFESPGESRSQPGWTGKFGDWLREICSGPPQDEDSSVPDALTRRG